jgi:hypothetical protein
MSGWVRSTLATIDGGRVDRSYTHNADSGAPASTTLAAAS